jgi:hypothetical protein
MISVYGRRSYACAKTPLHVGVEVEIKFTIFLVHIDCQLW